MRNLFDQYTQPENRLTHALLSCLAADSRLLHRFLRWVSPQSQPRGRLRILEQSLPGLASEAAEGEAESRGLPDGCITDGSDWSLLIEAKFAARLELDQLKRHLRTARRHGLENPKLLILTLTSPRFALPAGVDFRLWREVYQWLRHQSSRSVWAIRCAEYLEVAEEKGVSVEYLKEGALTVFSGIPFDEETPYTYPAAKRLLGLLREEVCKERQLRLLGADLGSPGRSAITGRDSRLVWDFIPLTHASGAATFTRYPHLTLSIRDGSVNAHVTFPNGLLPALRKRMLGASPADFRALIERVFMRMRSLVSATHGTPECVLLQRHYPSQRSRGVEDGSLKFDLRTALGPGSRYLGKIKSQPEWVDVCYSTLKSRRSNMQFQIGMTFQYESCPVVRKPEIARILAKVFLACEPILDQTLSKRSRSSGRRHSRGS